MERRALGHTGLRVGEIGLGTEHLSLDAATMEAVLGSAVDAGADYVDLLYCHPRTRHAEFWEAFGPALAPRRESFILAAHWGNPGPGDIDECERAFADTLPLIGGHAEVAMVDVVEEWGGWCAQSFERLEAFRGRSEVSFLGLSTHTAGVAIAAAESEVVDVVMYAVHLLAHHDPTLVAVVEACRAHGVGLVAMKPYYGGRILNHRGRPTGITPAQCLSYTLDRPISCVVPGPRTPAEWQEALASTQAAASDRDCAAVLPTLPATFHGTCTYCNHCMPCSVGINIGHTILWADQGEGGVTEPMREWYARLPIKASACTECGLCLERCPFGVDILERMRMAVALYETGP